MRASFRHLLVNPQPTDGDHSQGSGGAAETWLCGRQSRVVGSLLRERCRAIAPQKSKGAGHTAGVHSPTAGTIGQRRDGQFPLKWSD